jgi:hypothetical protein
MRLISRLTIVRFVVIGLVSILFVTGCDPYQIVSFNNQTSFLIQVDIDSVPLDYQGTPEFYYLPGEFINPGESKSYVTTIWPDRRGGIDSKYPASALNKAGEVIFYRVFTWDELNDMDWTIVITTSESISQSSDNTT